MRVQPQPGRGVRNPSTFGQTSNFSQGFLPGGLGFPGGLILLRVWETDYRPANRLVVDVFYSLNITYKFVESYCQN